MKKLFLTCAVAAMLSSCGSVLSLNEDYVSPAATTPTASTEVAPTGDTAGVLGGLLSSLAGNGSAVANEDGTALTTNGVISGLLGSVLEAFTTVDEATLMGTWNFKGSAFVFESENALASLGSDVVATQLEAKVDQYLAKFNIREGVCSITFKEDNTFMFVMGDRYVEGSYVLNQGTKELTMTFGMFKTVANVVCDADMINLVYQSDGLLRMLKGLGSNSNSGTLALLSALFEKYDGIRIGMAFAQ